MKSYQAFIRHVLCLSVISLFTYAPIIARELSPQGDQYIYLCKQPMSVADFVSAVSEWDANQNSPLHLLKRYIADGFVISSQEDVLSVLEYADWLLAHDDLAISEQQRNELIMTIDRLVESIIIGDLSVDSDDMQYKQIEAEEKSRFCGCDDDSVSFHTKTCFYKKAHFKDDVKISGVACIEDAAIENLSVTNCMESLCVNNLSVDNATVNNLTVSDSFLFSDVSISVLTANDAVINNLSVTDLFADTATINNLTVTNCMDDLCVTNLTVTNETVGMLSATDIVVSSGNITCDLTVGCNISMVDSADAAQGNIIKNGTPFIHNFGASNTFVGSNAGNFTTSGFGGNTGLGAGALFSNTTGSSNTAVGFNALNGNTDGNTNTAIGSFAMNATTTGSDNTAVGSGAMAGNMTGSNNVAVGSGALAVNVAGVNNTAVGTSALLVNTASFNIAIGAFALDANSTGTNNVAVGVNALGSNATGSSNVAIGNNTLTTNTTGNHNTAVGTSALSVNTTGIDNTAIGHNSLSSNTTGMNNTAVGDTSGVAVTTGSNNVFVGAGVGALTTTGNNDIYIDGNGLSPANESNTIRIGNTQTACFIQGINGVAIGVSVPVLINGSGQLGTMVSSKRFKHDIQHMTDESSALLDLNPVSFVYNADESKTRQFGLIAEEVDEVFPRLVIKDKDGVPYTVRYEVLPVLLLNEVKKLNAKNNNYDAILESMLARIKALEVRL